MEFMKKLETTLAGWYKQVPFHFPPNGRKWLTENVWWLVLIGVVVSVLALVSMFKLMMYANDLTSQYQAIAGYYGVRDKSWSYNAALWLSVVFGVVILVIEAMAIQPLKALRARGWYLLFAAMLVGAVAAVVNAVVSYDLSSLIGAVIGFAVGGYFLFEIHPFGPLKARTTKADK
jgi:hypothetical protein